MRLAVVVLLGLAHTATAENRAAAFGWQSVATTDLDFAWLAGDHTVIVRFFPQYTKALAGPLITSPAGDYALGIGAYGSDVHLELAIGRARGTYSAGDATEDAAPIPLENAWHTLAVVHAGKAFAVYLDGRRMGRDLIASELAITGRVQLGRSSDSAQFYGLIDDVAVFDRALAKTELDAIVRAKHIDAAAKPLRAWTFDDKLPDGSPLPPAFAHPVALHAAATVTVDGSAADVKALPPPVQRAAMRLPFEPGVEWRVTQEYEGPTGHSGAGAFTYDFIRWDAETCGARVVAHADGAIVGGCDLGDPPDRRQLAKGCSTDFRFGPLVDGYDFVHLEDAPDEIAEYLHIQRRSLREHFPTAEFRSPVEPAKLQLPITRGQPLARAGTRKPNNCHLHFGVTTKAGVGFPVAFSNYEVLDRTTKTWIPIARGIPRYHQIIRNPPVSPRPAR